RHNSISTAAAKKSRSATVPKLPTALNRCLATAEPSWTLTMPSSTSAGGGITPTVRLANEVREDREDAPATRGLSTIERRASRGFQDVMGRGAAASRPGRHRRLLRGGQVDAGRRAGTGAGRTDRPPGDPCGDRPLQAGPRVALRLPARLARELLPGLLGQRRDPRPAAGPACPASGEP